MEVPTDVVVVAQLVEQTVDIPALGARGVPGYEGLQGFLPEQGFFPSVKQTVLKVSSQNKVLCSALFSRSLTFQFPVEVPPDFLPDPGSAAAVSPEELFQGIFRTFPSSKKSAEVAGSSSARVHAPSNLSTPAAHHDASKPVATDDERGRY